MNGTHYARTSEAWLSQMDRNKDEIIPILGQIYGEVIYKLHESTRSMYACVRCTVDHVSCFTDVLDLWRAVRSRNKQQQGNIACLELVGTNQAV